jgi:hypothetical protein
MFWKETCWARTLLAILSITGGFWKSYVFFIAALKFRNSENLMRTKQKPIYPTIDIEALNNLAINAGSVITQARSSMLAP